MSTDQTNVSLHGTDVLAPTNPLPVVFRDPTIEKPVRKVVAPIRVLHVINGEHYAGAERVQDLLAIQLPECGFEVEFACLKPNQFPEIRSSHVPLSEIPMLGRVDLRAALRLARIMQEGEHQVIHAHTPRSALVASVAARLTGVPLVYHVHSPTSRDSTSRWRNWVNDRNERFCARRASALITVSHSLRRHMCLRGFPDAAISVVPNGVPVPAVLRDPKQPVGDWTIGTVALFRPRKGLEVLLEAIALLAEQEITVNLRAVGTFASKRYQEEIMHHVARLGIIDQIEWVWFAHDVPAELARMDLLALPSLFGEGLPMVVLEAMAAGVPVIASRVEGVPEAIDDGVNGLLADPGDPVDLAANMRRIIVGDVDWRRLRENARQTHQAVYSDGSMAAGVANVYRNVLAKSARIGQRRCVK